jgi:hypothetical protein
MFDTGFPMAGAHASPLPQLPDGIPDLRRASSLERTHALLPVPAALRDLLPEGGLRRGTVVRVGGTTRQPGSTALALALVAAASADGAWIAAVGLADVGLAAASELGLQVQRLALVPDVPTASWAQIVTVLADHVDVVLTRAPADVSAAAARRVQARIRDRRCTLVLVDDRWPGPVDLRLAPVHTSWQGLADGHGRLRARHLEIRAEGRGAAARTRTAALWLPDEHGAATPAPAAPTPLRNREAG